MDRYCIKCGKITTKRNDSLYVCISGHENWINPAIGSAVFIIKNNKVLYGIRSQDPNRGRLDLPGGFIEANETAEQAVIREAKEEVGADIELMGIVGTYTGNYQGRPSLDIVFVGRLRADYIVAGDDLKGGDLIWRELGDLPNLDEVADIWFPEAQKDLLSWLHSRNVVT
jgi:NAD+ diphosphatase